MSQSTGPLRLLLIDDDEDDFLTTRELLRQAGEQAFELEWQSDYEQALHVIMDQRHDLYLVDCQLGAESGVELISQALKAGLHRPFILLTGQGDAHLDADAMDLGAADYLAKGQFDGQQLARSIRYAIGRHRATLQLADSEMRYRQLFESNPEPIWICNKETMRFLAVNEAALRFFGYSKDEFLQMSLLDIRGPEEQARLLDLVDVSNPHAVSSPSAGIWKYLHKDGHEIYAEVLAYDIEFDNKPSRLVLAIDATEKEKARLKASQHEQSFRKLLDDNRDALLLVDDEGVVRYANPAAEQLFGASQLQLQQQRLDILKDSERLYEWNVSTSDGKQVQVEVHRSLTNWEGNPINLLSLRDITDRKASEQQLSLLKRSLESTLNGVVITDALADDQPIIYTNPAFERITGYSEMESLGRNCRFLQANDGAQPGIEEIRQSLPNAREVHLVLLNYRKDGTPFWNDLYISPVFGEEGQVTHFVGVLNDISDQKRYEDELSFNANHDALTGLPNRALLEDRLVQGCQISQRYNRSLAVIYIDLDGFKPINDSMDHQFGDQLLIEVARRITEQVRPGDTVARMGGDEFVVVLPDLARESDVLQVAERLITSIARPYRVQGVELRVTASMGIALSNGQTEQPMQLIQQADLAMHKAKQEGRNNYQWYTQDLDQRVNESVTLRNELQKAIENQAFNLHYQPQIDGRSGRVIGVEALLRWEHPEQGMIPPARFIPVAEDTGQIIQLSLWVLDTACRQIRELGEQGMSAPTVSVNISPVHFQRSNFIESIQAVLNKYQLSAQTLELELTETVLVNNPERAVQTMQQLKQMGVRIAIDDFGTGFSSLNYLKRLPIDKIKIDRSFIKEIISDQHDAAITQGIISMAHHLKVKVIAEGVETEPQFAFLKKSHCDEFQGYYFAKPMPYTELETFLRARLLVCEPTEAKHSEEEHVQTLLLLDDEENILRALARVLRRDGYRILIATRAQDAFELLAKHDVQVILSDQRMPEMNGTEFLSRVKDLYPDTVRMVLSGYTDLKSVTNAINEGSIYKFLTKPWDDEQLRQHIAQAFREFAAAQGKEADGLAGT